jgi:hypothetical protein
MEKTLRASKKEQLQRAVRDYMREQGINEVDPDDLTAWAIDNDRIGDDERSFFRRAKKDLIQAMRDQHQIDRQGREVRKMIAIRYKEGHVQKSLWMDLFEARPKKVHIALSQQRRAIVAYCRKHKQTVESYNDNNTHGAQLPLFDYNIDLDLAEEQQPTEYPDEKPEGDD